MQRRRRKVSNPEPKDETVDTPDQAPFEAREGDTLTIKFDGATLQIAPYSSVSLDSAIYSRRLEPGDDPEVEFDRVYAYLRRKCLDEARRKLAEFADEHAKAKRRASGG